MEGFIKNEGKLEKLKQRLQKGNVDISKWGIGRAKKLTDLQKEIEEGESVLTVEGEKLIRKVQTTSINVFYHPPSSKKYLLKREKQKSVDGRGVKKYLSWSVAGIVKTPKTPEEETLRILQEKLKIKNEIYLQRTNKITKNITKPYESQDYPGLQSEYTNYKFNTTLAGDQFKKEDYTDEQGTHFVWTEVK